MSLRVSERSVEPVLFKIVAVLEARSIPYMVMGGLASRSWGLPYTVQDLDLTLDAEEEALPGLCEAIEHEGLYAAETARQGYADSVQGLRRVTFQDVSAEPRVPVVCFLVTTAYQRAAFVRRRKVAIGDRQVWMISPEDLILHGLLVGSIRNLSDIDDILLVQGSVDRGYLTSWARELGVLELLEERLPPA